MQKLRERILEGHISLVCRFAEGLPNYEQLKNGLGL
jgi:hypothetical protein